MLRSLSSTTTSNIASGADIVRMAEDVPDDAVVHLPESDYNPEPEPDPRDFDDTGW